MFLKRNFTKRVSMIMALIFIFMSSFSFLVSAAVDFSDEDTTVSTNDESSKNAQSMDSRAQKTKNKKLNLAENNPIAAMLCKVIRAFTGTIAKVLAVFMILGLGVTMLSATPTSPVSPVTIVSVILGIGMLFSAETLVGRLMGDAGYGGDAGKTCDCKYGLQGDCNSAL